MTPNELKEIHIKAKHQWIEDNIRRLQIHIKLHETILGENKTLTEHERERMAYQSYLAHKELKRFEEMRKKRSNRWNTRLLISTSSLKKSAK